MLMAGSLSPHELLPRAFGHQHKWIRRCAGVLQGTLVLFVAAGRRRAGKSS